MISCTVYPAVLAAVECLCAQLHRVPCGWKKESVFVGAPMQCIFLPLFDEHPSTSSTNMMVCHQSMGCSRTNRFSVSYGSRVCVTHQLSFTDQQQIRRYLHNAVCNCRWTDIEDIRCKIACWTETSSTVVSSLAATTTAAAAAAAAAAARYTLQTLDHSISTLSDHTHRDRACACGQLHETTAC